MTVGRPFRETQKYSRLLHEPASLRARTTVPAPYFKKGKFHYLEIHQSFLEKVVDHGLEGLAGGLQPDC